MQDYRGLHVQYSIAQIFVHMRLWSQLQGFIHELAIWPSMNWGDIETLALTVLLTQDWMKFV